MLVAVTEFRFRLSCVPQAMSHTACRHAPGSVRHGDGAALRCRYGSGDSAAAAEAIAPTATRGRGRPTKAATSKSAGREPSAPSLGERVLALATGRTRQELYVACPNDRPNHIGIAVQRHLRAGR